MTMEKTPEEIKAAVLAEREKFATESTNRFWHSISHSITLTSHPFEKSRWKINLYDDDGGQFGEWFAVLCLIDQDSSPNEFRMAYRILGLEARDAVARAGEKERRLLEEIGRLRNGLTQLLAHVANNHPDDEEMCYDIDRLLDPNDRGEPEHWPDSFDYISVSDHISEIEDERARAAKLVEALEKCQAQLKDWYRMGTVMRDEILRLEISNATALAEWKGGQNEPG